MDIFRSWLFGAYKRQAWDMWHSGSPPVKMSLVGAVLTHPLLGGLVEISSVVCAVTHQAVGSGGTEITTRSLQTVATRPAPRADSGSHRGGLG